MRVSHQRSDGLIFGLQTLDLTARVVTLGLQRLHLLLFGTQSAAHTLRFLQQHTHNQTHLKGLVQHAGTPAQVRRPHLTLQVAVGLSSIPLRHLLPVAPDVGQDLVQTGFNWSVGFVHLTSSHLTVEDSHVLQGQTYRK